MRRPAVFLPSQVHAIPWIALCVLGGSPIAAAPQESSPPTAPWWPPAVAKAIDAAGSNRPELLRALTVVPKDHREDLAFLLEHMPPRDLRSLRGDFLVQNIAEAREALEAAPWGRTIPRSVYLNDVLPYAHVSETREAWRSSLRKRFWPLVKDCKTPGEAAQKLNKEIFRQLEVKYSTRRQRADQSPSESIASGLASCTGLSILLADACRAVAVPARLAGIKSWVGKRGNHTWVEIWDGDWHFTGAAEWSAKGLDHAWFQADAAKAIAGEPDHAIYAVSYRATGERFPMQWTRNADPVSAVNVTARYTGEKRGPAAGFVRVMVCVRDGQGVRRAVPVAVFRRGESEAVARGRSRSETHDTNDFLTVDVPRGGVYEIRAAGTTKVFRPGAKTEQRVDLVVQRTGTDASVARQDKSKAGPGEPLGAAAVKYYAWQAMRKAPASGQAGAVPAGASTPRPPVTGDPSKEFPSKGVEKLDALVAADPAAARGAVWKAYRGLATHAATRKDFAARRVRSGATESPYTLKYVGKKPREGWPLFIAMHGGGGVAKRVNDQQWRHMQIYYRDQKSVPGYAYVALRAPNDRWNGFYDHYVWPLVSNLIRQFQICADIDPDKVFLMGYSHGGYGAFAIGPHLADRFAWVHASAAAPTPGMSPVHNLRNLRFTYMIGERDTRYGRLERCRQFDESVRALRAAAGPGYPVTLEFKAGFGHGGLPDRDKIREMFPATRVHSPKRVSWRPTGPGVRHFYWIEIPAGARGQTVEARIEGNTVVLQTEKVAALSLWLDDRLVDLEQPVKVDWNGTVHEFTRKPSFVTLCQSIAERGDPALARTVRIDLTTK